MSYPLVIAHRGASAYEPENTFKAFRKALELNADMIEVDVRLTADGHPVITHDETVDRTTNGRGKLRDMTLKEVKNSKLDLERKFQHLEKY